MNIVNISKAPGLSGRGLLSVLVGEPVGYAVLKGDCRYPAIIHVYVVDDGDEEALWNSRVNGPDIFLIVDIAVLDELLIHDKVRQPIQPASQRGEPWQVWSRSVPDGSSPQRRGTPAR